MNIERTELCQSFRGFVEDGHGVVIGYPGAGKTHTLKWFSDECISEPVTCVYLPVDKLGAENFQELIDALGLSNDLDFFTHLKQKDTSTDGTLSYLVIDAFDAVRSDKGRRFYMNLIQLAMRELPEHWRVVVSVRTYDARKSLDMLNLFPFSGSEKIPAKFQLPDVRCRHFYVPLLDDNEVYSAASAIPGFRGIYAQISPSFRELLRTPFNLWLVERLSEDQDVLSMLTALNSEVELLTLFWQERVDKGTAPDARQVLVANIAKKMVSSYSLSVRKEQVYDYSAQTSWEQLLSAKVLEEAERDQRISFGHNILFDFAVSHLLIEETPNALESFLVEDSSRPLFLRPSLNYYFTGLWHRARDTFWITFWHLLASESSNVRLFARLLPTTVIARELQDSADLEPLYTHRQQERKIGDLAVLRLLQSLKSLDIKRDDVWSRIFEKFSEDCSDIFIGELATSLTDMQNRAKDSSGASSEEILSTCGKSARNMLNWLWKRRKAEDGKRFDGIGSIWLVPLAAKTFRFAPEETREVLKPVWDMVYEESFPIDYLYRLTNNIDGIWNWDTDFVAETYKVVFSYQEGSNEATGMGTPIMPLTSNRRQDYGMCIYNLQEAFPGFVRDKPEMACRTAVLCLTLHIKRSHVDPYPSSFGDGREIETFEFRGKSVHYVPDHSHMWAQHYSERPMKIADEVFKYLRERASENDVGAINAVIDILCESKAAAYFWREFFRVAAEHVQVMTPLMWELAMSSLLQMSNDTVHELGTFLTVATPVIPPEDLLQVENSLLALPSLLTDKRKTDLYVWHRDRLLGCIGIEHLQKEESRRILKDLARENAVPQNDPLVEFGECEWKQVSEEDYLERQGVNLSQSDNRAIFDFFEPLTRFTAEWQNRKPSHDVINESLPLLRKAWTAFQEDQVQDSKLMERLLTNCGQCAKTMARGMESSDAQGFSLCREILLRCAKDASPEPNEKYDSSFTHPGWSPAPRNEAAQGLPWLAMRIKGDAKIIGVIETLARDQVPSVRFLVTSEMFKTARNYTDNFWQMVEERAMEEENKVVKQTLCHTLGYAIQEDEKKACEILDRLVKPALEDVGETTDLLDSMVNLVMGLYIVRDNQWASDVADTILDNPKDFRKALHKAMLGALSYITPKYVTTPDKKPQSEKAKAWVFRGIDAASSELVTLTSLPPEEINEETREIIRSVYSSIDEVVTRFYFASGLFKDGEGGPPISDEERKAFYKFIKPILDRVVEVCDDENGGLLFAPTAHYLMQILNGMLDYEPKHILSLAHKVVKTSKRGGYNFDSMAVKEVVKLVESILANHRVDVRDNKESLEELLGILDIFSEVGWPEALNLVWRLDEVFR